MNYNNHDERRKLKSKYTRTLILASFSPFFIYFPLLLTTKHAGDPKIPLYTGILIFYLVCLFAWYKKTIDSLDNVKMNSYRLKEEIMANGEIFKGEVVCIRKRNNTAKDGNEYYLVESRDLVVRFFENNEEKYIVRPRFNHYIKIVETEKNELKKIYGNDSKNINSLKEKTIKLRQFVDREGCILFEDDGSDISAFFYEGPIEKNYEEYYTCKVYKYKNKYVVGDIEEYDYVADEERIARENRERIMKKNQEKEKRILIFIIVCLLLAISAF